MKPNSSITDLLVDLKGRSMSTHTLEELLKNTRSANSFGKLELQSFEIWGNFRELDNLLVSVFSISHDLKQVVLNRKTQASVIDFYLNKLAKDIAHMGQLLSKSFGPSFSNTVSKRVSGRSLLKKEIEYIKNGIHNIEKEKEASLVDDIQGTLGNLKNLISDREKILLKYLEFGELLDKANSERGERWQRLREDIHNLVKTQDHFRSFKKTNQFRSVSVQNLDVFKFGVNNNFQKEKMIKSSNPPRLRCVDIESVDSFIYKSSHLSNTNQKLRTQMVELEEQIKNVKEHLNQLKFEKNDWEEEKRKVEKIKQKVHFQNQQIECLNKEQTGEGLSIIRENLQLKRKLEKIMKMFQKRLNQKSTQSWGTSSVLLKDSCSKMFPGGSRLLKQESILNNVQSPNLFKQSLTDSIEESQVISHVQHQRNLINPSPKKLEKEFNLKHDVTFNESDKNENMISSMSRMPSKIDTNVECHQGALFFAFS